MYIHLNSEWDVKCTNPKYCLLFTFLLSDCNDSKRKETPCELVGTHLWVDKFFGSVLKMLSKEANNLDVIYVQDI